MKLSRGGLRRRRRRRRGVFISGDLRKGDLRSEVSQVGKAGL